MDEFEGTYAPQSPDLSGYQSYDEQSDPFSNSYYPPHQQNSYQNTASSSSSFPHRQQQQQSNLNPFTFSSHHQQQISQDPYLAQPVMPPTHNGKAKAQAQHAVDGEYIPDSATTEKLGGGGTGRESKRMKMEENYCDKPAPGVEEGIEVRTKFPVARIKRIMQADEDVGKVAQVTPTAVSKALELFMISVVTKAAAEARIKSSKRVTAAHLKAAVEKDEQLDFLAEIIAKVPDVPTANKKKEDDDSDDVAEGKRRKKGTAAGGGGGGGRKKRARDEEEE